MILLLLSIEAAECNVWCISENYDKGSYNKALTQCECIANFDYDLTKIKKKWSSKKSEPKPEEAYEDFEYSPYLKIK